MKNILLLLLCFSYCAATAQNNKVIIDADTGNEIDDFLAIIMALKSKDVNVIGLTAAHWNSAWAPDYNTMLKSWELNNQILKALNQENLPNLKGENIIVRSPWGTKAPRESDATDFIIKSALNTKEGEKLKIIVLGAATNIASSILINPKIIDKIAVYFIGARYNFDKNYWDKNEFNVKNDLNAFDIILNTENLELHVLTNNVSDKIIFDQDEMFTKLDPDRTVDNLLLNRWKTYMTPRKKTKKAMFDIGMVEAVLHPNLLQEIEVTTPPENTPRKIGVYSHIDVEAMKENFWTLLKTNN